MNLLKKNWDQPFPRGLFIWFILLLIGKLFLSSADDMVGTYSPHDDLWQVWAAERWYWGAHYGVNHLYRLPIYPLFVKLVSITGMPLRFVIEFFYSFSCLFFCATLYRVGVKKVVVGTLALCTVFQPYSFQLLNYFKPEVFLAPLIMLGLSYTIRWWLMREEQNTLRPALFAALFWALAWNTRAESTALLPLFFVLGAMVFVVDYSAGWLLCGKRLCLGVILPLVVSIFLNLTICTINYLNWGLFADSVLTAPGYVAAYKALQAIEVPQKIPYVPITHEAVKKAYDVSPTFALLKPQLEGNVGQGWAHVSKQWTDDKGIGPLDPLEIAGGWFFWALYSAVTDAGYGVKPEQADLFLRHVAQEINIAFKQEKIPKRFVLFAMVDPNISGWLPRYWQSVKAVYGVFMPPELPSTPFADQPMLPEETKNKVDIVANRRASRFINPSYYRPGQFWEWGWSWKIETAWSHFYYQLFSYLQLIAVLGIVFSFFKKGNTSLKLAIALCCVAVIMRILIFALFDATTCNGNQSRYLFAVMPEFSVLLILGTWLFFDGVKSCWRCCSRR